MAEQYRLENYKAKRERAHKSAMYIWLLFNTKGLSGSVGDPDPDPQDPHVFGPLGSGSVSQRYGSGSGSGILPLFS
jgi:hypothetical protein